MLDPSGSSGGGQSPPPRRATTVREGVVHGFAQKVSEPRYAGRVFERFTDQARQVVVLAQDEARELRHNYIGTEHILLGLLREDGVAAGVLRGLNVTVEAVREEVAKIIGQGDEVIAGQIPFTPRAKKVLELALREALSLGHNYIGSEHILLGVAREDDGVAARILHDSGLNSEMIRNEIIRKVGTHPASSWQFQNAPSVRRGRMPRRVSSHAQVGWDPQVLLAGWALFAIALGIGIAIGWAIWG
jgi:hypothetical protein